jgi:signal peptidase II
LSRIILFYSTAIDVVVFDQVTKLLARQYLAHKTVVLIPGFLDLRLAYNTGAAFGLLPNWAPLFIIVALVAIYAIVRLRRAGAGSMCLSIGLGMLLGGAMGNLIDRLLFADRGVTDFLDVHIRSGDKFLAWPTFNLADAAIVIGAILVVVHVYIIEKRRSASEVERHDAGSSEQT